MRFIKNVKKGVRVGKEYSADSLERRLETEYNKWGHHDYPIEITSHCATSTNMACYWYAALDTDIVTEFFITKSTPTALTQQR